jgi:hypothetical protein
MKVKIILLIVGLIFILNGNLFSQVVIQRVLLNGNNISAYFQNTGIFNQNTAATNSPGFEWPKGSNKFAFFTAGLCIAAKVNGQLAQSMAFYKGEFAPGFVLSGVPYTNANFKIYKISRGDNSGNNPDYANWPLMIPYGAPYIDVNNNHQYDPGTDSIGIRNAVQVIFLCMTDGFPSYHDPGEGFGGGVTSPLLYSQIAWTAWCYDRNDLKDIQFIKWAIINKSTSQWNSTYFSIVCDPDLGNAVDDYIGCDSTKKLGYSYNGDNDDTQYGLNPPAVGMILHKSPKNLTSFTHFTNTNEGPPPCESDPNEEPYAAYLNMMGFKKDSSNFMNPLINPPVPTKFVYTGDPETNTGWTEYKGSVQNCGGNTGNIITVNPKGDRRFIMSSGTNNYTVLPNDTVVIYASQLIARGSSNLNSVTLLKNYANTAWSIYNSGFSVGIQNISTEIPSKFSLSQNFPNPFNPTTKIRFDIQKSVVSSQYSVVTLKVFDILGKEIATIVNERLQPGTYEASFDGSNYSSGIYFYKLQTEGFINTKKIILLK